MWVPLKWCGRWTDIEIVATVGSGLPWRSITWIG